MTARGRSEHNSRKVEFEIELPGAEAWWCFALFIKKGEAQLDDFEEINITSQKLVLVVCIASELSNRPRHHARELSVLQCIPMLSVYSA